jgi:hypothetical protein
MHFFTRTKRKPNQGPLSPDPQSCLASNVDNATRSCIANNFSGATRSWISSNFDDATRSCLASSVDDATTLTPTLTPLSQARAALLTALSSTLFLTWETIRQAPNKEKELERLRTIATALEGVQAAVEASIDARTLDALATTTTTTTTTTTNLSEGRPKQEQDGVGRGHALDEVLEDALRECEGRMQFINYIMLLSQWRNGQFWVKLTVKTFVAQQLEVPLEEYAAVLRGLPQAVRG